MLLKLIVLIYIYIYIKYEINKEKKIGEYPDRRNLRAD